MTYITKPGHFGLSAERADTTATDVSAPSEFHNPDRTVRIIDRPCGSGKTNDMIKSFALDRRYLLVTPLLTECDRIVSKASVPFWQPKVGPEYATKKEHLASLLDRKRNVVTTHAMFDQMADLARRGLLDDYHIIIDEVVDVANTPGFVKPKSWKDIYIDGGYVHVDETTGIVSPTPRWDASLDEIDDTLSPKLYAAAMVGCLVDVGDGNLLSVIPTVLMTVGRSLTVYTYMAEGSPMLAYLRRLGLNLRHDKMDPEKERAWKAGVRKRITVRKIKALDNKKLSFSGQMKKKTIADNGKSVSRGFRSLSQNALKDVPRDKILITCPKELWYHNGIAPDDGEENTPFRPGPYAKGSGLAPTGRGKSRARWIPNTTRGTNDYDKCTHAIYLYDQYLNPVNHRWLGGEEVISNDDYALTELVQWVWRTAVRCGGEITVYIPSKRMRNLFVKWLWDDNVPTEVWDAIERRH